MKKSVIQTINLISYINKYAKSLLDSNFDKCDSIDKTNFISELHFHKILYYSYGFFYAKFKRELFVANFEAWKYGPVEKKYRELEKNNMSKNVSVNSSDDIFSIKINKDELIFLNDLLNKLIKISPYKLVEESHRTKPWKDNFDNDGKWKKIKNSEIQDYFSKNISN